MNRRLILWMLVLITTAYFAYAIECRIGLVLYNPKNVAVNELWCHYNTTEKVNVSCNMPFSRCFLTGMYTLLVNDTMPGCSMLNETMDFAQCDVTPPDIKGTSPKLFSVAADGADDQVNASWKRYEDNLVAYYPFEKINSTKALDWTNYSRHANITGGLTYQDGYISTGQAGFFDGTNDYLIIDHDLGNPSGMTLALWINGTNMNNGANYIMDGRSNGGNWWWLQDYANGVCTYTEGNICFDARVEIDEHDFNFSNNVWYHIAVVEDATSATMYVNGMNLSTGAGEDPTLGHNITIGARYTKSSRWDGAMDEIMIFNRTLNRSEITNVYLSGLVEHGLHRAPDSAGDTAPYTPSIGMLDTFTADTSGNYTERGDTGNVDWSYTSGALRASVNEQTPIGDYSYYEYKYLTADGRDLLIEYDVKFTGKAKTGGLNFSGVLCEINPNTTGWRDADSVYNFTGLNNSGVWSHVKLYIYQNRTGKAVTNLDIDSQNYFFDEIINVSSFSSTKMGLVGPRENDTMEVDNFKVTFLSDDLKEADTNATDGTSPSTPSIASVASNAMGELDIDWNAVADIGDSYFFYLVALDVAGNPSNIVKNTDFESGSLDYWTGVGLTPGTTQAYTHFGNYSLNVSADAAWQGVKYDVPEYSYYKGASLYWGCWAKAKTGTMDVVIGSNKPTNSNSSFTLTTTWQFIKHVLTVDSSASSLQPFIKTNKTIGGEFYLDGCTLQAIRSATVTSGIKDYRLNMTSPTNAVVMNWGTATVANPTGLDCFLQYKYKLEARDNKLQQSSASSESSGAYPIPTGVCRYGSGALGFCLDNQSDKDPLNDLCYYDSKTGVCGYDTCVVPGNIIGDACYFDGNKTNTVARLDDCGNRASPKGCNVTNTDHMACTVGDFTASNANCWASTNCYWNSTAPCSQDNGWAYRTSPTNCSAGDATCCPNLATYSDGVACTTSGPTGTDHNRDDAEAYCQNSVATGCDAQVWTNISLACCGDDGISDNFYDVGYEEGACVRGDWGANHCTNGESDGGETSLDYGGPWCNDRPEIQWATLNASSEFNYTTDNLTAYFTPRENDSDEVFPVVDWMNNSKSIMVLNMPFQTDNTSDGKFKDFTTFENNGTGKNGVGWTGYGLVGGAAVFDGKNDYINVSNDESLNITGNISIIAWIRTTESQTSQRGIVDKSDGTKFCGLDLLSGDLRFFCYTNGGGSPGVAYLTDTPYLDGNWHLIVGMYNGSNTSIWIDGVFKNATRLDGVIVDTSAELVIGARTDSQTDTFNGTIDEVRIFNRSLSSEQIAAIYADEYNQRDKLALNMHFGQNQSRTVLDGVRDFSQYENNGTLGGGSATYAPAWNNTGKIGGSYYFDGAGDYINVSDSHSLDASAKVSIAAWVKDPPIGYIEGESAPSAPYIVSAQVEPTKVVPGDLMRVSAEVKDAAGIAEVTAEMPHEKGADILLLQLINGSIYEGVWENTWVVHDTIVKDYTTEITARNLLNLTSTATVGWSDPTTITDTFSDETKIDSKENISVSSGKAAINYSSGLCYQETATQGTSCGGLNTGAYKYTESMWGNDSCFGAAACAVAYYDGNWATWTLMDAYSLGSIFSNYTKPLHALNTGSLWEVKNYSDQYNLSISSNCWSRNPLQLRIEEWGDDFGSIGSTFDCFNGSDWQDLLKISDSQAVVNEEGMYWNMSPTYEATGRITSTNLLSGQSVTTVDSFGYSLSSLPSGTTAKVQFSQDNSTWKNSTGNANGWDSLSSGAHSLDISGLSWAGANFYYQVKYTSDSDGNATPQIDFVNVTFTYQAGYTINQTPVGIDFVLVSSESTNLTQNAQTGVQNVLIKKGTAKIVNFSVDFTHQINLSDVVANISTAAGKSVFHVNKTKHTYVTSNFTLRIPAVTSTNIVYICPNATSLAMVNASCPNIYWRAATPSSGYYLIKVTGSGGGEGSNNKTIADKAGAYGLQLNGSGTRLIGRINTKYIYADVANPTNWHFEVLTYDGSNIRLYIDGALANTTAYASAITTNANELLVGQFFSGLIDEVKVFNATLTQQEITNMYRGGINKRSRTLVSNETERGDNWTANVWLSDGILLSSNMTTNYVEIKNGAPTIASITEAHDPIKNGTMQNITANTPADIDHDPLSIFCCNDTVNTCTPSAALNLCDADTFTSPYANTHCNFTVDAEEEPVVFVRCRLYDGTDYSTAVSTSFTVDPDAPIVNVIAPGSYVRGTKRINATVSDAGTGLKDNSCKWAFYTVAPAWSPGSDNFAQSAASGVCYKELDTTSYTSGTLYTINFMVNDTVNNNGTDPSPEQAYVCNDLNVANCGQACEDQPGDYYNGAGFHSFKFEAGTTSNCCPDDAGEFFKNTTIGASWHVACCDSGTDCVDVNGDCHTGSETSGGGNCDDGLDNDCDGTVDYADSGCCPTIDGAVFVVQNSTGKNCTMVDIGGDMRIKGSLTTSCAENPGPQDFVVKTGAGATVFWVNHTNCNACLKGGVNQDEASIAAGSNEFLIKNKTAFVMKIDSSGDLYITGFLGGGCG